MFKLNASAIHPGGKAENKAAAIRQVASALVEAGHCTEEYLTGMFAREQQTSTWLGNGIAIPHGTTETRDQVLLTGVQVFHYPDGVSWGEGQIAYLVIGIAARSDEHLSLLRQLTHVLSDDRLADIISSPCSTEQLLEILMPQTTEGTLRFDASTITLNVAASDLLTLQALNAGRLQQIGAINNTAVSQLISVAPFNLGQGIWLNESSAGNLVSAVAISRLSSPTEIEREPLAILLTIVMADDAPGVVLERLSELLTSGSAGQLITADIPQLIALLTTAEAPADDTLIAEFTIRNPHGLHARPGTALVNVIKQFDSEITITNLDGSGHSANGRSLLKVVALGVKKGHRLRFTARGEDASDALKAIDNAIKTGLGEENA